TSSVGKSRQYSVPCASCISCFIWCGSLLPITHSLDPTLHTGSIGGFDLGPVAAYADHDLRRPHCHCRLDPPRSSTLGVRRERTVRGTVPASTPQRSDKVRPACANVRACGFRGN